MRKLITIVALFGILISNLSIAQSITANADTMFKHGSFSEAIPTYKGILKKKKVNTEILSYVHFQLGECYRKTGNYNLASIEYLSSKSLGNNSTEVNMYLGDMLIRSGKYGDAIKYMEERLKEDPSDLDAKHYLDCANYGILSKNKLPEYEVKNEVTMNTDGSEYGVYYFPILSAVLYPNDKDNKKYANQWDLTYNVTYDFLYWITTPSAFKTRVAYSTTGLSSSKKIDKATGLAYTDIYEVLFDTKTKKWGTPDILQGLNTPYNDAFFTYNAKEKTAYFTQCNGLKYERNTCNIYTSIYNDLTNTWSDPVLFDGYSSEVNEIIHPSISEDGNTLFFVSNMPGSISNSEDIWMLKRENGIWSHIPINLGPKINTPYTDAYPFIYGDSLLYFSSIGHTGMGGFDIYLSKMDAQGNFSEPVNLGSPINSSADDFGITLREVGSKENGWFSSNRQDELNKTGQDDIYSFKSIKKLYDIKGNVREKTKSKVLSKLKVICNGDDGSKDNTLSDNNGDYIFRDKDPEVNYTIIVVDADYLTELKTFKYYEDSLDVKEITKTNDKTVNLEVLKVPKTKEYEIKNIYWDFNKWDLRAESKTELDKLIDFLKETKQYIVINAYTDAVGSDDYNLILSYKRANAVVNYLIYKGVSKDKLAPIGHGENDLAIKNAKTEDDNQKNRRTTFQLLKSYQDFASYYSFSKNSGIDKIDLTKNFDLINNNYVSNNNNVLDGSLNIKFKDGVEYRVQFIATRTPVNSNYYNRIKGNTGEQINYSFEGDGFHRYSVGSFTDFKAAVKIQQQLKNLGYDSFIVAYNNGKKITIKEAKSLLNN